MKTNQRTIWRIAVWLLIAAVVVWCASCATLYEEVWEQRFERPSSDVELPTNPPWDSLGNPSTSQIGR